MFFNAFKNKKSSRINEVRRTPVNNKLPPLGSTILQSSTTTLTAPAEQASHRFHVDVCSECQNNLLHTFSHCIYKFFEENKDGNLLNSLFDVDEDEDGLTIHTPPEYEIVHDPSIKLTKNEMLSIDGKGAAKSRGPSMNQNGRQTLQDDIPTTKSSLIRMVLQAKNREIQALKKQLNETSLVERIEEANVEKLQRALGKAVKYYAFAEEWKEHETGRLREDVQFLKRYVSTLMAFILSFDDEKFKLRERVSEMDRALSEKTELVKERDTNIQDLTKKLQETYKDYAELLTEFENLKNNTANSKELQLAKMKIESLTSQYQSLSNDLAVVNKALAEKNSTVQKMEFELSEIIRQFNVLGSEKTQLLGQFRELQENHTSLTTQFNDLQKYHKTVVEKRDILQADLTNLSAVHEQWKTFSEKEIKSREVALLESRANFEKLNEDHKAVSEQLLESRAAVTRLEEEVQNRKMEFETVTKDLRVNISIRDERISTLVKSEDKLKIDLRKAKEDKDALVLKVNTLKQEFDSESSSNKMLQMEVKEVKKASEEKNAVLIEENGRLVRQKEQISNEKLKLVEEIRNLRIEIEKAKNELSNVCAAFEKAKEEWKESSEKSAYDYHDLKNDYDQTSTSLKEQREEYKKLSEAYARLKIQHSLTSKELQEKVDTLTAQFSHLFIEHRDLTEKEDMERRELEDTKYNLELLRDQHETLASEHKVYVLEAEEEAEKKATYIRELESDVNNLTARKCNLEDQVAMMTEKMKRFKDESEATFSKYQEEKRLRESAESQLDIALKNLATDRMLLHESEMLIFKSNMDLKKLDKQALEKISEKKRRLEELKKAMSDEHRRLSTFLDNMPDDKVFDHVPITKITVTTTAKTKSPQK